MNGDNIERLADFFFFFSLFKIAKLIDKEVNYNHNCISGLRKAQAIKLASKQSDLLFSFIINLGLQGLVHERAKRNALIKILFFALCFAVLIDFSTSFIVFYQNQYTTSIL